MEERKLLIRLLESKDIAQMAKAWNKPASQYAQYFMEQEQGIRAIYLAFVEEQFAGYLTICWTSGYEPFRSEKIPEIVDFNILPKFRRQGIGSQLMNTAEAEIAKMSSVAGIGVGMDPDYGAAQRLYVLRGYVPDGRGLHYHGRHIRYGEEITVDDSLALYLTKELH
jgi:GNAT superfamily N-acetyltransferase